MVSRSCGSSLISAPIAPPPAPSTLRDGDAHLVEEQFGRVGRQMSELLEVSAAAKARPVGLDQNEAHAARAALRRGPGDDDDEVAHLSVRDEGFLARDHELVALAHGSGADALKVAAGAGFGHRDGAYGFAGDHSRQPFLLLLGASVAEQVAAADVIMHREVGGGTGKAGIAEFLDDDRVVPEVSAGAAEFFGDLRAEQSGSRRRPPTATGR